MTSGSRANFPQKERLRDPAVFRRAFEQRKSASSELMVVYAVESGLEFARLGISIGRKKVRKATRRNGFKRIIREAFRLKKSEIPVGIDMVVVPRRPDLSLAEAMNSLPRLATDAARRLRPVRGRDGPLRPIRDQENSPDGSGEIP